MGLGNLKLWKVFISWMMVMFFSKLWYKNMRLFEVARHQLFTTPSPNSLWKSVTKGEQISPQIFSDFFERLSPLAIKEVFILNYSIMSQLFRKRILTSFHNICSFSKSPCCFLLKSFFPALFNFFSLVKQYN